MIKDCEVLDSEEKATRNLHFTRLCSLKIGEQIGAKKLTI